MGQCNLCPRMCNTDRAVQNGVCSVGEKIKIARATPHFWEEPCISGIYGSGAVFFSGCNLKCVFCQNSDISSNAFGEEITEQRLREIYSELLCEGVHNINLVTPTHFADKILNTLSPALPVPVVYNSSGYDSVETLKKLNGKIQIYLPDLKYMNSALAAEYSKAPDYPEKAIAAIKEMFNQTGNAVFDSDGIMQKGVIIRHLMLPDELENTLDVIDWVFDTFHDNVVFSLMSQYTPPKNCDYPSLLKRVSEDDYEKAVDYMYLLGMENAYVQDFCSADKKYTPSFDLTGV